MSTLRDIQFQSGDPAAILSLGRTQSQGVSQSVPESTALEKFNMALLQMLQQSQQLGTKPFAEQEIGASEAQARRILEPASSQFSGASPGIQSAVTSDSAQALEPTIAGARTSKKTFQEQITSFENILKTAKEFGAEIAKITPSPEVTQGYLEMIRAGGNPSNIPDEVRGKVLAEAAKDPTVWNDWQEANRKGVQEQLTLYQQEQQENRRNIIFNSIVDKYQKSPLIQAADRASATQNLLHTLRLNPGSRENQLIAIYQFVQILDNYQSAVREGEIGLLSGASSVRERVETAIKKLQKGQAVNPSVILNIVSGMETLVNSINSAALRKEKQFEAQSNTSGVGDKWSDYRGQFNPTYQSPTGTKSDYEKVEDPSSQFPEQRFNTGGFGYRSTTPGF